jgi:hypothetical protein
MTTQQMSRNGQATAEATTASLKTSRRRVLLPIILMIAALLMSACGWQGVGVVTGKGHSDGFWYPTTYCGGYDAKGMCTFYATQQNYMPESWSVDVRDDKGEVHTVSVNEEYWSIVENGARFDNRDEK